MKKAFYILSTFAILASATACNKNAQSSKQEVNIDAEVASGDLYQLDLAKYGSVAAITKQAVNYTTSKVAGSSRTVAPVYQFSSNVKSAAIEQVVLAVTDGKTSGRCRASDSTIVTINFSVK
jgi:hypothetical protein